MIVDLAGLFDNEGASKTFDAKLDLSAAKRWGDVLFPTPVTVTGRAYNRAEIVNVSYQADFVLDVVCDRCLTPLTAPRQMKFSHIVVPSLNRADNGEFIVIPDGKLDLAELVTSDILLEIPTTMVCDEACKGLCPVCGKNLNDGACGCDRSVSDPRLAKLRELLQE